MDDAPQAVSEERKTDFCHYEVMKFQSNNGLYFQRNRMHPGLSTRSLGTAPLTEINFPHEGPHAVLWLVRGRGTRALAVRNHGKIIIPFVLVDVGLRGVTISARNHWLEAGDGFVVTALTDKNCEAGPIDLKEGRPRPTVYV